MSAYPSCIRAIPYESEDSQPLTMCLYMDTNGERIPEEIKTAAKLVFRNYETEFDDLLRRPLKKIVTQPSQRKSSRQLDEISRKIEQNLFLFENRMNVTAVQASYKVIDSIEQDTPCVTVYVINKGKIPAGETDLKKIKEENGHLFNETEFDVADGYYKMTNGSSLECYASYLHGGVGIGVEGANNAGTLGGFLEDEEGNVYILSNQHVLHPPDATDVIVQPSELDYENMHSKCETKLNRLTEKINRIRQKNKGKSNSVLEETEKDRRKERERLDKIKREQPRPIGKYVCGVKDNHAFGDIQVYVDAAIARLDENELSAIKEYKNCEVETKRCRLYGFATEKYCNLMDDDYHLPNGEIVDFQSFQERIRTEREVQERSGEPSELRFMKIGKSTGFTDEGCFDIPKERIHVHFMHSEDIHGLVHIKSLWARNCFLVGKRRTPFSEEGDSGALVFDNEGRAWGLAIGNFDNLTSNLSSIISPLFVALDALKQKSGKKELKLWWVILILS